MATELVKSDQLNASFQGMTHLPVVRQVGLLVGLAASIALGIYVVLWSRTPDYTVLYHQLSSRDTADMVNILQQQNIPFKVDTDNGLILVASSKVQQARLALAAQDLPRSSGNSFDLIAKDQGFGTSDFIQNVRYQHALEGELANTIMSISAVENARVHLALPKESAFLADTPKPSASVFVDLAPGRHLRDEQVAAIVHLVASSVPNMESSAVTLVDNNGNLLSNANSNSGIGLSTRQLEYKQKVESDLESNIENILSPIVGPNKVRAQVVASMDFSQLEMTSENFNPDSPAIRSEQRVEERSQGGGSISGVPGALSNQPPGAATAPQQVNKGTTTTTTQQSLGPQKSQIRYTVNNELDRSIVHRRDSPGMVKRLSVAVIVDHKMVKDAKGKLVSTPYTPAQLARFTTLVKEAVGFDAMRGDSVNVVNAAFSPPPQIAPLPPKSFLEQPWVKDVGKQVLGGLLAALVLFGVLRPVMRNLARVPNPSKAAAGGEDGLEEDQVTLSGEKGQRIPKPNEYESDLEMAKAMVIQEPKRVAQVVKQWVNEG